MPEDPDEITKLLRLKRFEQPPPEYFEDFLQKFHHRQRAELLREPAWRIAWDRLVAFFGEQMPVRLGYGLASTAVLLMAAVASLNILETRPIEMAYTPHTGSVQHRDTEPASLALNIQDVQVPALPAQFSRSAQTASFPPRYVMDARPVSYEPPSSF